MATEVSAYQRRRSQTGQASNVVNRNVVRPALVYSTHRLRLNPNENNRPQNHQGIEQDFSPELFSKMEKHLPPHMLSVPRDAKFNFMKDIVDRYISSRERRRLLHTELYTVAIEKYFTPRFLKAVNENSEAGYRSIMAEPCPGVFTLNFVKCSCLRLKTSKSGFMIPELELCNQTLWLNVVLLLVTLVLGPCLIY